MGLIVNNDNGLNGKVIKLGELIISWDEDTEEQAADETPVKPNDQKINSEQK